MRLALFCRLSQEIHVFKVYQGEHSAFAANGKFCAKSMVRSHCCRYLFLFSASHLSASGQCLPQPMTLRPDPPAVVKVFLGPVTAVVLIMSSFVSVPGHTLAPISRLMALVWGNSDLMKDSKANRLVFGISKFEPLDPLALFETIPKQI